MRIAPALIALTVLGGATAAQAQQHKTTPAKPPAVIYERDYRYGPPVSPATRPDPAPRPEIGKPMERLEPLPKMSPRVGN